MKVEDDEGPNASGHHNYTIQASNVRRDAYRLLTIIMADQAISEMVSGASDALASLRGQFIEDEVVHTLIQLAVFNRTHIRHMNSLRNDPREVSFPPIERNCGTLQIDATNVDERIPLEFYEACNKVIHAEQIAVEPSRFGDSAFDTLQPVIVLRGRKQKKAWQAWLDLPEYLRGTAENFDQI